MDQRGRDPCQRARGDRGQRGEYRIDAADQKRRRHRAAERVGTLGGQIGEAKEAEGDEHTEPETAEQQALFEHVCLLYTSPSPRD